MNRFLRRDPLRKYDLKSGEPFGVSGSWVVAPDGMSLLPVPDAADHARSTPMTVIAAVRQFWHSWPGSKTGAAYFDLDHEAGKTQRRFARPGDPGDRAGLLGDLAVLEQEMADTHMATFGPHPIEWEDGRDLAESLANSARVLWLISDAYFVAAGLEPDDRGDLSPEQHASLNALEHAETYAERAAVLEHEVYPAFVDEIGGQAAEVIVSLASCERKAGKPGRRPYRPNRVPRWLRVTAGWVVTIALSFLAPAVAICSAGLIYDGFGDSAPVRAVAAFAALVTFWWLIPDVEDA
jgi:hypothetical protein